MRKVNAEGPPQRYFLSTSLESFLNQTTRNESSKKQGLFFFKNLPEGQFEERN